MARPSKKSADVAFFGPIRCQAWTCEVDTQRVLAGMIVAGKASQVFMAALRAIEIVCVEAVPSGETCRLALIVAPNFLQFEEMSTGVGVRWRRVHADAVDWVVSGILRRLELSEVNFDADEEFLEIDTG